VICQCLCCYWARKRLSSPNGGPATVGGGGTDCGPALTGTQANGGGGNLNHSAVCTSQQDSRPGQFIFSVLWICCQFLLDYIVFVIDERKKLSNSIRIICYICNEKHAKIPGKKTCGKTFQNNIITGKNELVH